MPYILPILTKDDGGSALDFMKLLCRKQSYQVDIRQRKKNMSYLRNCLTTNCKLKNFPDY